MCTNPLKTHKDIDKIISSILNKHKSMITVPDFLILPPARIKIVKNKIVDFNFKEPLESGDKT